MKKLISTRKLLTYAVGCILFLAFSSDTNAFVIWQTRASINGGVRAMLGVPGIGIIFEDAQGNEGALFENLDINPCDIDRTFILMEP
jgi:hypothetical protein